MGGPETFPISFYGTGREGILLVQCTLNGTRCAVSVISFDRLLCLKSSSPGAVVGGTADHCNGGADEIHNVR